MLNKLLSFVRQQKLIAPGDTVTCAVSGGADSVALLFALYLLRDKLKIQLSAAHFNHHLRGEESDRDEAFVREFCERYDIPLAVGHGNIVPGKKGLEAAARDARYAFLRSLPGKIATAHTADDNAETVLMHLVRGTGLKGLGGIAPVNGKVIRPMLSVTRQEVESFCAEWCLSYITDSSNEGDAFLRNRLRHHVMPILKQENPQLSQNLSAMALRLRQDEDCLSELAACTNMEVARLREMHPALRSRAVETFLKRSGVREPEACHVSQVESLVFSDNPSAFAKFPGGITIARNYGNLEVRLEQEQLPAVALPVSGSILWGDYRITTGGEEGLLLHPVGVVTIRSRQTGDTIRLSGGSKTLKKLYIDRKIPAAKRSRIPVLCDELGILAVYGMGTDLSGGREEAAPVRIQIEEIRDNTEEKEMHNDIAKVLITEEQIQAKVRELGEILTEEYKDKNPVVVGVLKGVVVFYADMIRQIQAPCQMDFMWISSYAGTQSKGMIVRQDVSCDIAGRHVLILEDIFDTGNSLQFTWEHLMAKNPASLKICTFLDKPERRREGITVKADYTGFTIPNEFVVGYGLDFDEKYRNLPYIGVLKPEMYSK